MSTPENEPKLEVPPEGAHCHEHPESLAIVVCPRCGHYACLSCWHDPIARCHACLMLDPLAAGEPVPFEDAALPAPLRFLRTFGGAIAPSRSAPGFVRGSVAPALGFALLSFVPIALLAGIIPFTATLLFEPVLAWRLVGTPTDAEVATDIARAAGLGLLLWGAQAIVLGTAYASLVRAYLTKGHAPSAARVVLYRAWLLPLTGALMDLGGLLGLSPDLASILGLVPLVLLMSALVAVARMGAGVGRFSSFVVVMVPVIAMLLTQVFLVRALQPILPDTEAIRRAREGIEETPAPPPPPAPEAPVTEA